MVSKYLLRIEAVNLDGVIFDTSDLSTVRGGSWLLLEAIKEVAKHDFGIPLIPISVGASIGLFTFESDAYHKLQAKIEDYLDRHPAFRHATFVVSVTAATDNNGNPIEQTKAREKALALGRWQQMKKPTVTVRKNTPGWSNAVSDKNESEICKTRLELESELADGKYQSDQATQVKQQLKRHSCSLDSLRPVSHYLRTAKGVSAVSASTAVRKIAGRDRKQSFYARVCSEQSLDASRLPGQYANEFLDIAKPSIHTAGLGKLNRKLAVIYLDGNGFTRRIKDYCNNNQKLQVFDHLLQQSRAKFLEDFLKTSTFDPTWNNDGVFQLETLLWGGDEILWVVPAWQGWNFLYHFFDKWKVETSNTDLQGLPDEAFTNLTHGAGLVFCNYKSPIHTITRLAKKLADLAKFDRESNGFAYEILESFDHTGDDLESFRKLRSPLEYLPARTQNQQQSVETVATLQSAMQSAREERKRIAANKPGTIRNLGSQRVRQTVPPTQPEPPVPAAPPKPTEQPDRMLLKPDQMHALDRLCREIKRTPNFPRGPLRNIAIQQALPGKNEDSQRCYDAFSLLEQNRYIRANVALIDRIHESVELFHGDRIAVWCHINQLWDYIGLHLHPESEEGN